MFKVTYRNVLLFFIFYHWQISNKQVAHVLHVLLLKNWGVKINSDLTILSTSLYSIKIYNYSQKQLMYVNINLTRQKCILNRQKRLNAERLFDYYFDDKNVFGRIN